MSSKDGSAGGDAATVTRERLRALQEKYLDERNKRFREEGNAQYVAVAGSFARYSDDPHAPPDFRRDPIESEADAVIVGGGISGMLAAANLVKEGVRNFAIIEKGTDFGGTWYWNRYPGIACDVESYIYIPMLEEIGYVPTEKYAKGEEILAHCQAIGRHFELYERTHFQTLVEGVEWDENIARWIVRTNRNDVIKAKFIALGTGPLNRAKLPGISGIESFKGKSFHTSRWDYSYTGGGPSGNLVKLGDKRVAVIGTGATAVQCIPHLGQWAERLYVFQRTPTLVDTRGNRPTDPEWVKSLRPGWQRQRIENFDRALAGTLQGDDLVGDQWTDIRAPAVVREEDLATGLTREEIELAVDAQKMDRIRARIDAVVKDRATAEALKPYYSRFCKRPCFHDEYLETFNRSNVTLIDTQGRGVERVTEDGVVAGGEHYNVDCIVYATGFEHSVPPYRSGGFAIHGRGGLSLEEKWKGGIQSLHGMYVHDFPNLFIIGGVRHSGLSVNIPYVFSEQAKHFAVLIKKFIDDNIRIANISSTAEEEWGLIIKQKSRHNEKLLKGCTPGAYNNEGAADESSLYSIVYGGGSIEYCGILDSFKSSEYRCSFDLSK